MKTALFICGDIFYTNRHLNDDSGLPSLAKAMIGSVLKEGSDF